MQNYYQRNKNNINIQQKAYRQTPEAKEVWKKWYAAYMSRPEVKERRRKWLKESWSRPEVRERILKNKKVYRKTDKYKKSQREYYLKNKH